MHHTLLSQFLRLNHKGEEGRKLLPPPPKKYKIKPKPWDRVNENNFV